MPACPMLRSHGISLILLLGMAITEIAVGQPRVTQADLLMRLVDLDRLATPITPDEPHNLLFSSYDRRQTQAEGGRYLHWDSDDDAGHFYGRTDDGWNLMVDHDGPGALLRWWVDEPHGDVRIELDGQVVLSDKMMRLFDGGAAPFGAPLSGLSAAPRGAWSHFPIGFEKSCRVMTRGFAGRYQVDALAWPGGTRVETFSPQLADTAMAALRHVSDVLNAASPTTGGRRANIQVGGHDEIVIGDRRTTAYAVQQDLAPGEKFTESISDPGVIRALYVSLTDRVEPREARALHRCVIRLTWDGAERPSVELPLTTFFGAGFERSAYASLAMGTDRWLDLPGLFPSESWFMYCLFPMPFESARVEIENRSESAIGLMLYMRVERATPSPDAPRFHATYRVEDPCETFDFPLLTATGPGRVVGCVLNVDSPREAWWGRGDHKIWLDDDRLPSIFGTGTADYFGTIEPLRAASRPFSGVTLAAPHGKNSLYRWHVADSIAFPRAIRFTIENWQPDNRNDVYYASVVYWYGPLEANTRGMRVTEQTLRVPGLRIPGSIECEGHVAGSDWGRLYRQRDGVELSGGAGLLITADGPVEFRLPIEAPGTYRLSLRVHPTRPFGSIRVQSGDGSEINAITWRRDASGMYEVGEVALSKGVNSLFVICDRPAVLDCWVLTPVDP